MHHRTVLKISCVAFPLLLLVLCAGQATTQPAASPPQGSVTHVVICYLKAPADAALHKQIIEASRSFTSIPGVLSVSAGSSMPTTRPHADASFDIGIVITFSDVHAYEAYLSDPAHMKAVKELLVPLAKDWKTYDFINE